MIPCPPAYIAVIKQSGGMHMTTCSFTALREKEVINLCDGHRLGYVCDVEFTLVRGDFYALDVRPGR